MDFLPKGFPQFMKNPWLLLRFGPCGSPLHIANTGALSASGTTPRKWQVTKSMDYNSLMDNSRQMVNNMG